MQEPLNTFSASGFCGQWIECIHDLQNKICAALEKTDGEAKFNRDEWKRSSQGGGGITRVIANGRVFEKGGVNTSVVHGPVTPKIKKQLHISGHTWFAAGLSLVVHPLNPFVPTVHCNYRYFEVYDKSGEPSDRWFGGGTDLTPCYLIEGDVTHFHRTYKEVCDRFDGKFYPLFKKNCDEYFVNAHRNNERRGVGGIFFDHRKPDEQHDLDFWYHFAKACGTAFTDAYIPIVEKRKEEDYTIEHRHWQEIRRGRYVEFNLIHDRGTLFGLKTNGRAESILMSLPPTARFEYDYHPLAGTPEADLIEVCLHPRDWAEDNF